MNNCMKKSRRFSVLLMLWFNASGLLLSAQQMIDPVYFSVKEGLASSSVVDILQDRYGLIWIATINGLQKYDGYRLETFKHSTSRPSSIQSSNTWSLLEDEKHDIWVATDLGVSRLDRRKNEFVNYNFSKIFRLNGSPGRVFRLFKDSDNRIWAGTRETGLVYFDPVADTWKPVEYQLPKGVKLIREGLALGFTEDAKGGLWAGSVAYGLMHRKKGEKAFRVVPKEHLGGFDFTDLFNNITELFSDRNDILWITTRNGVYKYNPTAKALKTIIQYTDSRMDGWNNWNKIVPDPQGNIWITNNFRGILRFDGISDKYEQVRIAGKLKMNQYGWNITIGSLLIDRSGIFWFTSLQSGLLKYDPVNKPFSVYAHDSANASSMSANGTFGLLTSKIKPGIVYVGTRGGWLNILDTQKRVFTKTSYSLKNDLFGGSVRSIAENKDGSLLLGTWGDGMIKTDQNYREIKRFEYEAHSPESISNNSVRVIKPDKNGLVWVGTDNGINIYNPQTGKFRRIPSKETRKYPEKLIGETEKLLKTSQKVAAFEQVTDFQSLSKTVEIKTPGKYLVVVAGEADPVGRADFGWIENAKKDTVWQMGNFSQTFYAGGAAKNRIQIEELELKPGSYQLHYDSDDSHAFGKWNEQPPDVTSLYGIALISISDQNSALIRSLLPQKKEDFFINGTSIKDIEIGSKYVWVAVLENGLNRIDPVSFKIKNYVHDPANENSLSNNNISDIYVDDKGILWLATEAGVNRFDPQTEKFTKYTEEDGLPTNLMMGILQGDKGEMWISTENGISQMINNEALGKTIFINYNSTDGLGGDIFTPLVVDRAPDGQFYFGGDHGITTFKSVSANKTPPDIIISNLLISNKFVTDMKEDSPLKESLMEVKNITLNHDQNSLSFEFAALHYANPAKNQYAHMLKGYDKDWIYDNRNFATYTNLDPGKYEFMIRASNAYGIWNEQGKVLYITILPPWWKTWWAYSVYIILLILTGYTLIRIIQNRIKVMERERSRERELEQAREIEKAYTELKATQNQLIQSEKMASLGELTAGIAHEIQNPLNFVNNFSDVSRELLDEMKTELDQDNRQAALEIAGDLVQNLEKIAHHGKRADAIVKGMLQHSRSSNGLKESVDINALCDEYLRLSYHGLRAKDKSFNATLKTDFDPEAGKVSIVPQDLGRVILNLLNNAFYAVNEKKIAVKSAGEKFDPTVSVSTKKLEDRVEISISDNANGIPQKVLDKIFQPFFTTKPTGQGTGLGLSLSYDIVTKGHGGELKVETREGQGSTFIISLPV